MTAGAGHSGMEIVSRGPIVELASSAAVLLHGRGGSPEGMLTLAREVHVDGLAWLAPRADRSSWYPHSFLAPLEDNEPWLSSALAWLDRIVGELDEKGLPPGRVAFVGFSQGACLAAEFVARHPRRYGGAAVLSGGLIGPPETDFAERYGGVAGGGARPDAPSLDGTPIFLGCSDVDPHIPEERVHESARVLESLGADVTKKIYPGMAHTVIQDELDRVRALLEAME